MRGILKCWDIQLWCCLLPWNGTHTRNGITWISFYSWLFLSHSLFMECGILIFFSVTLEKNVKVSFFYKCRHKGFFYNVMSSYFKEQLWKLDHVSLTDKANIWQSNVLIKKTAWHFPNWLMTGVSWISAKNVVLFCKTLFNS